MEARAAALRGIDLERPAVGLDDAADDDQPHAQPVRLAGVKGLEPFRRALRRQAGTVVAHADLDRHASLGPGTDDHAAAARSPEADTWVEAEEYDTLNVWGHDRRRPADALTLNTYYARLTGENGRADTPHPATGHPGERTRAGGGSPEAGDALRRRIDEVGWGRRFRGR